MGLSKKLSRTAVPVAVVAGVAIVGAGLYPAIASSGSPELPEVTVEELLVKIAGSDTEQLSGTVRITTGAGLPNLSTFSGALGKEAGPVGQLAGVLSGDSTLRIAVDGPDRQRLAVVDGAEEFSLIHKNGELWGYDSGSNTVYRATAPMHEVERPDDEPVERLGGLTPQEAADRLLKTAGEHADISMAGTARVAGQDVYQLLVEPTEPAGRAESFRVSVDAETGVPLAFTVQGRDQDKPLLDVAFSRIDYDRPAGGSFDFIPPQDATIVDLDTEAGLAGLLPDFLPNG